MFGIFGVARVIGPELVVNSANAIGCVVINIGTKHLIEGRVSQCTISSYLMYLHIGFLILVKMFP